MAFPCRKFMPRDLDHGAYLEQDLGNTTLFDFLSSNRPGESIAPAVIDAYRKVVAVLPRFQVEAGRDLDYSVCYPRGSFDRQSIAWDLNYFKYYFLRLAGIPFNEQNSRMISSPSATFCSPPPRITSCIAIFSRAMSCCSRTSPFLWITRAAARARCNTTLLPFCMTPRRTCRPIYASNCSTTTSIDWQIPFRSIGMLSCATTTLRLRADHAGAGRLRIPRFL